MKNNTAILNAIEKTIKFIFNNEEFTVDLTEGDLHDSWNCITDKNDVVWDVNFTWDEDVDIDNEPNFTVYPLTEPDDNGCQSTIWEEGIEILITEMIGTNFDYFNSLTAEEIDKISDKDMYQSFDTCSVCGNVELGGSMNSVEDGTNVDIIGSDELICNKCREK